MCNILFLKKLYMNCISQLICDFNGNQIFTSNVWRLKSTSIVHVPQELEMTKKKLCIFKNNWNKNEDIKLSAHDGLLQIWYSKLLDRFIAKYIAADLWQKLWVHNFTNITKTNNHIKQLKTTALRLVAVNPVSGMGEVQYLDACNNSGRVGFISPLG